MKSDQPSRIIGMTSSRIVGMTSSPVIGMGASRVVGMTKDASRRVAIGGSMLSVSARTSLASASRIVSVLAGSNSSARIHLSGKSAEIVSAISKLASGLQIVSATISLRGDKPAGK